MGNSFQESNVRTPKGNVWGGTYAPKPRHPIDVVEEQQKPCGLANENKQGDQKGQEEEGGA